MQRQEGISGFSDSGKSLLFQPIVMQIGVGPLRASLSSNESLKAHIEAAILNGDAMQISNWITCAKRVNP